MNVNPTIHKSWAVFFGDGGWEGGWRFLHITDGPKKHLLITTLHCPEIFDRLLSSWFVAWFLQIPLRLLKNERVMRIFVETKPKQQLSLCFVFIE